MSKLKKYTSFEAMKSDEKADDNAQSEDSIFLEFEAFMKRLRSEYSNKKMMKTNDGKQSD
ncbi:hypothetical protein WJR50_21000 [Catalinimonas sp. 4WD22]|uniref:hypothetical protein n=1 Tax=Catalinimonas locisalis TaxID=3133978 RepID=UPI003101A873